jgi:hypothetical protein
MTVDTKKVKNRRVLKWTTLEEVVADARQLAVKEREGKLVVLGNWTLGQAFGHLAQWITYSYEGVPFSPPWFIRVVAKLFKKHFLYGNMPVGVRFPKVAGGTYGVEVLSTQEGLARLVAAAERLKSNVPQKPNSTFGVLTHEEWKALHVTHSRLHLSFFDVK